MKSALVTGASGFIGGHLVDGLLARGYRVRCLVRQTSRLAQLELDRIELCYGDLHDEAAISGAVAGVDAVFHAAGLTNAVRRSVLTQVNGQGTELIARACAAQANPPRLLLISSLAAAGPSSALALRRESDVPQPVSHYGSSKRRGELAVQRWADQVPATIVRPGIVIGPRNVELLPIFRLIAKFGLHLIPGWRDMPVTVIHVDDLVEVLLLARERGSLVKKPANQQQYDGEGYYFVGDPQQPTYEEFGNMIGRGLGREAVRTIKLPLVCCRCAAFANQWIARLRQSSDSFNLDKMREASARWWSCDVQAAGHDLNFLPAKSLSGRIRDTCQWYRGAGWI